MNEGGTRHNTTVQWYHGPATVLDQVRDPVFAIATGGVKPRREAGRRFDLLGESEPTGRHQEAQAPGGGQAALPIRGNCSQLVQSQARQASPPSLTLLLCDHHSSVRNAFPILAIPSCRRCIRLQILTLDYLVTTFLLCLC